MQTRLDRHSRVCRWSWWDIRPGPRLATSKLKSAAGTGWFSRVRDVCKFVLILERVVIMERGLTWVGPTKALSSKYRVYPNPRHTSQGPRCTKGSLTWEGEGEYLITCSTSFNTTPKLHFFPDSWEVFIVKTYPISLLWLGLAKHFFIAWADLTRQP